MPSDQPKCLFCNEVFRSSRYHPNQKVCSSESCQRKRKSEAHRKRLQDDPAYREECSRSQRNWREKNTAHLKEYRTRIRREAEEGLANLHAAERARLMELLKRGSFSSLTRSSAEVWLLCPSSIGEVEKVLADAKLIILNAELSCFIPRSSLVEHPFEIPAPKRAE